MEKGIIITGCITFALLLLSSCQPPIVETPEPSISRLEKDPLPYKILTKASPQLLNYNELTNLLENYGKNTKLTDKTAKLFSTPFIDNAQYRKHGIPEIQKHATLGDAIRVSTWNIEKSIHVKNIADALESEQFFQGQLKPRVLKRASSLNKAMRQRAVLAASDILLCQEVDIGHCRSGYLSAAKHLAQKLKMNFVYAPQQLEIDPVYLQSAKVTFPHSEDLSQTCSNGDELARDYKGVFGVAVFSRYPVKRVQVFPLKNQPYDWYSGEIQQPDFLEKLRRFGSEKVFHFRPTREIKTGGRGFTRVDLHVPGVPHETLSVINIHLEIKTRPQHRKKQLEEILEYIKDIKNPVIMAGDFNNASRDVSSTSLARASSRSASDPSNILATGLFVANATIVSQVRTIFNGIKNFKNPLAWNIPAILPNKKESLFRLVENYRFEDGGAFDFRGDKKRSINGRSGTLANSNQRTILKGFTFTFSVPRPIGPIGQDRLDWIFVKSFLTNSRDKNGSYQLAPHFGETLSLINKSVKEPFSDHHPITTLLPLNEPEL